VRQGARGTEGALHDLEVAPAQPLGEAGQRGFEIACSRELGQEEPLQRTEGALRFADRPGQARQIGAQIEAVDQAYEGSEVAPLPKIPAEVAR